MEDAQKKGMLLLLQNLDPSYTSMEVEVIVSLKIENMREFM